MKAGHTLTISSVFYINIYKHNTLKLQIFILSFFETNPLNIKNLIKEPWTCFHSSSDSSSKAFWEFDSEDVLRIPISMSLPFAENRTTVLLEQNTGESTWLTMKTLLSNSITKR